ncbi:MAG TPA: GNAT family N-acetyltransferase [Candidatus Acidoferrales bacterium]|nr:GNAT family N-acetyltransferase [Candidatus Acidoferrales bacterium]
MIRELINMIVDLDERFASDAPARERVTRLGCELGFVRDANDPVLAWIDDVFGGSWSSEVAIAAQAIATRDGRPAGFAAYDPQGLRFAWLRGIAREPDVGIFGPFGVDPNERGTGLGGALLEIALCGLRARGYRRALIPATSMPLVPYYKHLVDARIVECYDVRSLTPRPVRTVVLASGNGTNFQTVIDRVGEGSLPLDLQALVCNKPEAFAIERAQRAGIETVVVPWDREAQSRDAYDRVLQATVAAREPELVLLLGWMHVLEPGFIEAFSEILNVHPAFLPLDPARESVSMPDGTVIPAFRGPRAVRDALAANSPWVGASVHEVTALTDRGRVLVRKPMRVTSGEEEDGVLARLHPLEHSLVAFAIRRWLYER